MLQLIKTNAAAIAESERMKARDAGMTHLGVDCWLMVLAFAVKAGSVTEPILEQMKDSPLWCEMKEEAMRVAAAGHMLRNNPKEATKCLAKVVHANPSDGASYAGLLHCSSGSSGVTREHLGALLRLEDAMNVSGKIFELLKTIKSKDQSRSRLVLAKCIHKYPQQSELWQMKEILL